MASTRLGAPEARNRTVLLDAAERLMLKQGYAAVTSRTVARAAGLKHQLVHYYFRTMDDLFVEMLRRRAEEALQRQAAALASATPLRSLLEFNSEAATASMTMEFMALANHRKTIRAEVTKYARQFRRAELAVLPDVLRGYGVDVEQWTPAAVVLAMASVSRSVLLEQALGMDDGHTDTRAFIEREVTRLEGPARPAD